MNGGGKGDKFGMPDNMGELSKQSLIERDGRNERVEWLRNKSERTIAEIYELYLADWCEMNGKFRKGEKGMKVSNGMEFFMDAPNGYEPTSEHMEVITDGGRLVARVYVNEMNLEDEVLVGVQQVRLVK